MGFKFNSDDNESISDINIIPLVDVVLVVLIIFMVTAPMIMKPSIRVHLPKSATGEHTDPSKLSISISADGKINLNGSTIDEAALRTAAQAEFTKDAEVQAVISADKDVIHGKVVSIMDIIKSVGVKKFAITIDKSAEAIPAPIK